MPRMFRRNKKVELDFPYAYIYISLLPTAVSPEDQLEDGLHIIVYNFNSASPMLTITQTLVCKKSMRTLWTHWVSLFVGVKPGKNGNVGLKKE